MSRRRPVKKVRKRSNRKKTYSKQARTRKINRSKRRKRRKSYKGGSGINDSVEVPFDYDDYEPEPEPSGDWMAPPHSIASPVFAPVQPPPVSMLPLDPEYKFDAQIRWLQVEMTRPQERAISHYTGPSAFSINTSLRDRSELDARHTPTVCALDDIFNDIPALTEDIIVYRGVNFVRKDQEKLNSQGVHFFNDFISTSLSRDVTIDFLPRPSTDRWSARPAGSPRMDRGFVPYCCLFVIHIPSGNKVLPILGGSTVDDEREVLLPRGITLEITSEETQMIRGKLIKVVNMKVVPDTGKLGEKTVLDCD